MAEARDRLPRAEDVAANFSHRRRLIGGIGNLADDEQQRSSLRSPAAMRGSGSFGTPRLGNGWGRRNLIRSPVGLGRENMTPVGSGRRRGGVRGRGSNSSLPSWYPRAPLRDITAIVRATERRRALLRASEGQEIEIPITHIQIVQDSLILPSGAQHEQEFSKTPKPTLETRDCLASVGKVSKILLDITKQENGESDSLTPQKKLLNSIDTVEKVVMEELQRFKRTPTAKKAEREKRVRTLMSMR